MGTFGKITINGKKYTRVGNPYAVWNAALKDHRGNWESAKAACIKVYGSQLDMCY